MGFLRRLYRGETGFDFVGPRKRWYLISTAIFLICVGSIAFKGFNFGIEFAGGTQFMVPKTASATLEEVRTAAAGTGAEVATAQQAGSGQDARYLVKTGELSQEERAAVTEAVARTVGVSIDDISVSNVSSSWGSQVTQQALIALGVFLALVTLYLWVRFEQKMAFAALVALAHDVMITAGIYSLVGFEVTPSMVIGMLTILGYSLYDTVVVFDKVQENTRGLLGRSAQTYAEASNLAVNQTLMRSINTTLTSLLPVGALLFVGVYLLGAGTLKDLALVLFVGMLAGTYSSLFIATPSLVDFKNLEPRYRAHEKRVFAKRAGEDTPASKAARRQAKRAAEAKAAAAKRRAAALADGDEDAVEGAELELADTEPADAVLSDAELDEDEDADRELAGSAPRPGARPGRDARKRAGNRGARAGRGGKRRR